MDEKPRGDTPAGTQSLGRSIRLMRVLATRGEIGWRLSDLAAACGLDKGTAHRILASLVQERLVRQRPGDRRYLPGPLLFELSLALPGQHKFQVAAEAQLLAWSRRINGTALLLLRSGVEYVCSVRTGPARLPGLMVDQGTRRPLFTSVGGVAILQTLPANEAEEVLQNNIAQEVARRGDARLGVLQKMRERSARNARVLPILFEAGGHPSLVYRHKVNNGDLLMWDNGVTMHRRDEMRLDQPRLMKRTTFRLSVGEYSAPQA